MHPASNADAAVDQRSLTRRGQSRWLGASTAIANAFAILIARSRDRRALAALDERLLLDVGIDRRSAGIESTKPLWRR